jgi:hypothetical protein
LVMNGAVLALGILNHINRWCFVWMV